jgi:uncharacterized protein
MKYSAKLCTIAFVLCIFSAFSTTRVVGQSPKGNDLITVKPFALTDVKILDGPFKDALERDIAWLKMLDCDRLLAGFRTTAGLPSKAKAYGGWEAADPKMNGIRGHFMGHYLSALAKGYASTGDKDLKTRADYLIAELGKCQDKLGTGYIGAEPESAFDDLNQGKKVEWVPWYTEHKIFAGLFDVYTYMGNPNVYAMIIKLTEWTKKKTDGLSPEDMQRVLNTEQGGMTEVLANIYEVTKRPDHLALTKRFEHRMLLDNMSQGKDNLTNLHANTQIPKMIGAAREYEVTTDPTYRKAAEFFWNQVAEHRSSVTGGNSIYEHFKEADKLGAHVDETHADETCNAYNILKLTEHLYGWTGNVKYVDFYERALINSILASQSTTKYQNMPAGMMTYHQPIRPGMFKRLNDPENSFWCCTGSGSENHVQYGRFIYAADKEGLYINLFIASQLNWIEKRMTVKQETNFPEDDVIKINITEPNPTKMKLRVRIPYWATNGVTVKINGKLQTTLKIPGPGSYLTIERVWGVKEELEITMPMSLHKETMPDNENIAAFLYGPVVLSGKFEAEGITLDNFFGTNGHEHYDFKIPAIPIPVFSNVEDDLNTWIKPVKGQKLTFQTVGKGIPTDVTLVPYYKQFFERYTFYWNLCPAIAAKQDNPILAYKFNETVGNVVSNEGNAAENASVVGDAAWVPGKKDNALKLEGKSYVKLPDDVIKSLGSFSIDFWVNIAQATPGACIFDFGQDNVFHMYLEPNTKDGKFKFAITQFGVDGEQVFTTEALPVNTWKHVTLSFEGEKCVFYIDGAEVGWNEQITIKPIMLGAGKNNYLGRSQDKKAPMLNGMIDDFKIWNRPLDPKVIGANYSL